MEPIAARAEESIWLENRLSVGPDEVQPVWQIARRCQEPLRVELQTLARLSLEEHQRLARRYPSLFPRLHFAIGRLRDAVLTHFENEQALLMPLLCSLEQGEPDAKRDLQQRVPELTAEQDNILSTLMSIRAITAIHSGAPDSPMLGMLLFSLRRIDRNLRALFALEDLAGRRSTNDASLGARRASA